MADNGTESATSLDKSPKAKGGGRNQVLRSE